MMTKDELLAKLNSGADAEALAQQFIDNLNEAIKEKNAADDKAKEAEKKLAAADALCDMIKDFLKEYYAADEADLDFDGKALIEMLDALTDLKVQLKELEKLQFPLKKTKSKKNDDEVIKEFLANFGL